MDIWLHIWQYWTHGGNTGWTWVDKSGWTVENKNILTLTNQVNMMFLDHLGSCVLKTSVVECWSMLLINLWLTHLINISIRTWLTSRSILGWHSVVLTFDPIDSRPIVDWLLQVCIDWKLSLNQHVGRMLMNCQPRCWWRINQMLVWGIVWLTAYSIIWWY